MDLSTPFPPLVNRIFSFSTSIFNGLPHSFAAGSPGAVCSDPFGILRQVLLHHPRVFWWVGGKNASLKSNSLKSKAVSVQQCYWLGGGRGGVEFSGYFWVTRISPIIFCWQNIIHIILCWQNIIHIIDHLKLFFLEINSLLTKYNTHYRLLKTGF